MMVEIFEFLWPRLRFQRPLVLLMLVALAAAGCGKKQESKENSGAKQNLSREAIKEIEGKWKVVRYDFALDTFVSAEDKEIDEFQGKVAEIAQEKIVYMGKTYTLSTVEVSTRDAGDYFMQGYRTYPDRLGFKEKEVKVFDLHCGAAPFCEFFMFNPTTIVHGWDGIFYFLERQK